jgi:DNA-directed RNA polymerase subunit E'/Rpb7
VSEVMDIFVPIRFRTNIQLAPSDLLVNFEQVLLHKLRSSLEGVCTRYGYIRPGSIEIVKRSAGSFIKQHFNGHVKFDMVCRAEVCNPGVGSVFEAVVKNKNALGVHAESILQVGDKIEPVLDIIIPKRSVGIVSEIDLEELQMGDKIFVEVLGKRYQLHDRKISVIGKAIKEPPKAPSPNDADEGLDEDKEINPDEVYSEEEDVVDLEDEEEGAKDEEEEETDAEEPKTLMDGGEEEEEGEVDDLLEEYEDGDDDGDDAGEEDDYVDDE